MITIGRDPDYRGGKYVVFVDGQPTRIWAGAIKRNMTYVRVNPSEYPNITPEMIAAVAAFDFPAFKDAEPIFEDLTVDCACGEEAGIAPYTDWDDLDWAGGVNYRCGCCGRTWRVAVTVEAVGDGDQA